jgi:hypothetical protein
MRFIFQNKLKENLFPIFKTQIITFNLINHLEKGHIKIARRSKSWINLPYLIF